MRIKHFTVLLAMCSIILNSCKKEDPAPKVDDTPSMGQLKINFSNEVDGDPLVFGVISYTNAAGNPYSVDLLKYYVTNVVLIKSDSTEFNVGNYDLIDASDSTTCSIDVDSIPNGTYTSVRFYLGVDPSRNHTGAQDGDLSPTYGMIWTWNTGYIFFKHEGKYKNSIDQQQTLRFHYGTDIALAAIQVPVSGLEIKGNSKKMYLKFNLNQVYTGPTNIDFNVDNNHQSSVQSDIPWINTMRENFADAFSFFDRVE